MKDENAVVQRLAEVFADAFQLEAPAANLDLIETGILDSLQLVELLYRLEREFGTRIPIEHIDLDDLRTLERIAGLVAARTTTTSPMARAADLP